MDSYLINSRMKNSFIILLTVIVLFTLISFSILNIHYKNLKRDYIDSFGNVLMIVNDSDPELAKDIIPSITGEEDIKQSKRAGVILKEYGLSEDLENSLFPNINETYMTNNMLFILIFILLLLVLFILNFIEHRYFYRKIRKISNRAKDIVKGEFKLFEEKDKEGDFPKLISSFNSMVGIIKGNLEKLDKEKNFLVDLLSDISHQLKTPLSSMIVYNDILTEKELPREKQLIFLENNKKQLERIEWLVKSLLKLARLDVQAIKFDKEKLNVNNTIKVGVESLNEKIKAKKIKINFDSTNEIFLNHDFYWLKEAIINLIVNAIDHSEIGSDINIFTFENPIYRRIEIQDYGEGIDKKDLPHIFKRFYKSTVSQNSDSVGIGLALSKSIIESHNGIIEAESIKGEFTRFIITFLKY
ncbi:sensor histidine kinase [Senegalia massiliensis]|uniref:sensor histidine kinase n=1 Tax=Senegalia massiliensis TaxID=1720316 RepID=UPI00191C6E30|nr:HAMP domain-containing sensor histidine kinase [Senegalia massiliensis]